MNRVPKVSTKKKEGFKVVLNNKAEKSKQVMRVSPVTKILYPNTITITQYMNTVETSESKKERKRPAKKDDFDYKSYIDKEIERLDAQNMEKNAKRKLIQKIRNKMSAQRSRERSKNMMKDLQQENADLKSENSELKKEITMLKKKLMLLGYNIKEEPDSLDRVKPNNPLPFQS